MSRLLAVALAAGAALAGGCASTTSPSLDPPPSAAPPTADPASMPPAAASGPSSPTQGTATATPHASTIATPAGPASRPSPTAPAPVTSPAGSPADETEPLPVTVDAFGFSPIGTDGSNATYAAVLTNPNRTWAIYRMLLLVDFYSTDDAFVAGEELSVTLLPGQTTAIAGESFGAGGAARIEVRPPDDTSAYMPFQAPAATIEVGPVTSEVRDGLTITRGSLTSGLPVDQAFLQLAAVYRAADGTILGGTAGAIETVAGGGEADFEIVDPNVYSAAATEVYWQIGGTLW